MDDLERLLHDYRRPKREMFHNIVAELKLIDTDRPEKKYLEFEGIRYVFEDGKYVGWYDPGTNTTYPLDDPEEMTRVSGLTEEA